MAISNTESLREDAAAGNSDLGSDGTSEQNDHDASAETASLPSSDAEADTPPQSGISAAPAARNADANPRTSENARAEINAFIDQLNALLAQGQLRKCIAIYERCQSRMAVLDNAEAHRETIKNLKQIEKKIRELKQWRHWSTDNARNDLIGQLEKLNDFKGEPKSLANRLDAIRKQWDHWNKAGDFPSRSLRERFDNAYEIAYAPCKEHFKAQKKQRKQNKKARKAICISLEELFQTIDWHHPDWPTITKSIREAHRQWKVTVPLNKQDWKSTNTRFETILALYKPYIAKERERGIEFRRKLIAQAVACEELPTRIATERVKKYQRDWNTVHVRAKKAQEKMLWDEFKTACDKPFAHRREQDVKRKASAETKKLLLNELKSINALPIAKAKISESRAAEIRQHYNRAGTAKNRTRQAVDNRFDEEFAKFKQRCQLAQNIDFKSTLSALAQKAMLCDQIEVQAMAPDASFELESWQKNWQALSRHCGEFESAMQLRFDAACRRCSEKPGADAREQENLELKLNICLNLEALFELESPPEFAQARMQNKVDRLTASLSHRQRIGQSDDETQTRQSLASLCTIGPIPADQYQSLQLRFEAICKAFCQRFDNA